MANFGMNRGLSDVNRNFAQPSLGNPNNPSLIHLNGSQNWQNGNRYVDPSQGYSNTMAAITRQQYQDYLDRYADTEKKLVGMAMGDQLYDKQLARNQSIADSNFTRADDAAANSQSKYGLGDRRTDQQKRNLDLKRGLSLASMNNESREAIGDLRRDIMTGTSSRSRQNVNNLAQGQ